MEFSWSRSLPTFKAVDNLNEHVSKMVRQGFELNADWRLSSIKCELEDSVWGVARYISCSFNAFAYWVEKRESRKWFHKGVVLPLQKSHECVYG